MSPDAPPLDWIVLKICSRCNINCRYCYVYNRGSSAWRGQPVFFSLDLGAVLGSRIREHCITVGLRTFTIELHGGEPLLYKKDRFRKLLDVLRRTAGPEIQLQFCMQTNGLLLDDEWLEILYENEVTFGISLDGPVPPEHDQRVDFRGVGTTQFVVRNIESLRANERFRLLSSGALCVVNPELHGGETVKWFVNKGFSGVGFLLPDGNYVNPPRGWVGADPYIRFFDDAFEYWSSPECKGIRVRNFAHIVESLLGEPPSLDSAGGDLRSLCTVETDGSIGANDVLAICGDEVQAKCANIASDKLGVHVQRYGLENHFRISQECARCSSFLGCGGGHIAHRFDGLDFARPSFHCEVLKYLVEKVRLWLESVVPRSLWKSREVVGSGD